LCDADALGHAGCFVNQTATIWRPKPKARANHPSVFSARAQFCPWSRLRSTPVTSSLPPPLTEGFNHLSHVGLDGVQVDQERLGQPGFRQGDQESTAEAEPQPGEQDPELHDGTSGINETII
jgi:hypothetical protein